MRAALGVLDGPGLVVSGEATRFGARGAFRVRADGAGRLGPSLEGELPEAARLDRARGAPAFGTLARPPEDVTFATDASSEVPIARGTTGHVLARVTVGGETGWFVVDTGAGGSTALDAAAAARLGLGALGSTSVGSVEG